MPTVDSVIHTKETSFAHENEVDSEVMSIEEYRNLKFTPEQEWNNTYNPKRVSIEAVLAIEIKKRGDGPIKNVYVNSDLKEPGPYYDPECRHVHNWKKKSLIKNFKGEQSQSVPFVQFTDDKPGIYCSICHCKNFQFQFKWRRDPQDACEEPTIFKNNIVYKKEDFLPNEKIKVYPRCIPVSEQKIENLSKVLKKWKSLTSKVVYSLTNEKTVYPISTFKSLYLWPWQLTPYQNFKVKFPDYKSSVIFVKSDISKFMDNYAVII